MKNPPLSSEQLPDSGPTPSPDSNTAEASILLLFNSPDTVAVNTPKLILVDSEKGPFDLFVDLGQSAPDAPRPEGVKASIPLFYLPLPPMTALAVESPATVPVEPGLVYLLNTYPGNLPSTAEVPIELATRLHNEVADHLDCKRQVEVQLADVNDQWLHSFQNYLETFYEAEIVAQYVEAIRLLLARYGSSANTSSS